MAVDDASIFVAADLGASNGRVIAGVWDGDTLQLDEIQRFATPAIRLKGYCYWDVLFLHSNIVEGLRKIAQRYGEQVVSISVDTWAVDYGLLDSAGELLANPICYRDDRTNGVMEDCLSFVGREEIYKETGIQFLPFNTLYQLVAERRECRIAFESATRLLFLPDLLNYWLSGVMATERTVASSSQMLNPHTGDWSKLLLEMVELGKPFMGSLVEPGTVLGGLKDDLAKDLGASNLKVVAGAGHDTASAFLALPSNETDYAILSSGTWSLMGLELKEPNCSVEALEAGFSNEIGYGGTVRFLKNICGLWLIEESLRQWRREGEDLSYDALVSLANEAEPMASLFDPDDTLFSTPGNLPERIRDYCRESGQVEPLSIGGVVRSIFDSLVMKYRYVFRTLGTLSPRALKGIHILGGSSRNALLNQMTADALGVSVVAGPAEATSIGNLMVQMIASGCIAGVAEGREMVGRSFPVERYRPRATSCYESESERFRLLVEKKTLEIR